MVVLLSALTLFIHSSQAGLGDSADAIEKDRARFEAIHQAPETHSLYTIHSIKNSAITINEYIDPLSGKVFALTWQGSHHPDLAQLLSSYYSEYADANQEEFNSKKQLRQIHGRVAHHQIQTDGLVVEKSGQLMNSRGRIYATDLLPKGVSPSEIH